MPKRKILYSFLAILLLASLIMAGIIFYSRSQKLKVIFLDVGQGDAILIEQGNKQILVDGGPDGQKIMEKLGKYIPFWDRNIELVITTHPDQDHISGLIDVVGKYDVGEVIGNDVASESQVYKKFKEVIRSGNVSEAEGVSGMKIKLSNGAEMEILSPDGTQAKDNPKDTNLSSITARLVYGKNSFLLTGDLPIEGEQKIIKKDMDISQMF